MSPDLEDVITSQLFPAFQQSIIPLTQQFQNCDTVGDHKLEQSDYLCDCKAKI